MQKSSKIPIILLLAAVGLPPAALSQTTSVELEVGFQFLDVSGNEDMYRTQFDEDDGLVVRDLSVTTIAPEGSDAFIERLRIDAAGFGGVPDGRFLLEANKARSYRFRLFYSEADFFSALPAFANPLLSSGVVPGQHTWDRERTVADIELELIPGRSVTPVLGYRRNDYDGPGTTTQAVGADEFLLEEDLDETEEELRLGLAFRAGTWSGAVFQGWRDFEGERTLRLASGAEGGNSSRPVLGTDNRLDELERRQDTDIDGTLTNLVVSGTVGPRFRIFGEAVRSDYDSDIRETQELAGSLVSFDLFRFFEGQTEFVESRADNPGWRGEARVEAAVSERFSVDAAYAASHREVDGFALISTLFLETLTFAGTDPRDIERLLEIENALERDEERVDLRFNGRRLGPARVWAGYARIDQEVSVVQDAAQIVLPGGQAGEFDRQIDLYHAGLGLDFQPVTLSVEYLTEDADRAVVRTDFRDRQRWRGRVDWTIVPEVRLGATVEDVEADNDIEGIDYDADFLHWAVDLDVTPIEELELRLTWDSYEADSTLTIRRPETFLLVPSIHSEDADLLDAGILWERGRIDLEVRYSTFENRGTLDLDLDRGLVRFGVDLVDDVGAVVEYENWDYSEPRLSLADYEADRWAVLLRWRR